MDRHSLAAWKQTRLRVGAERGVGHRDWRRSIRKCTFKLPNLPPENLQNHPTDLRRVHQLRSQDG